jgi:hypothetical protein
MRFDACHTAVTGGLALSSRPTTRRDTLILVGMDSTKSSKLVALEHAIIPVDCRLRFAARAAVQG